jgi:PAS domain S-box-containing protein
MRSATNSQAATALRPADTETVKLLLVDDDRDTLLALQAILEPLNQELILAESGQDALRMCLDHNIAAILLDVRMPEMDGFETAELIRSRKRSRHTPILFLTAYRSDEQLFRGYDLGAVDFLFKPLVPEILQSKVSVFVELSRSEQTLRRQAEEIARAEEQFRAVLEGAPDAMLITSGDGTIELANSRVDALFGHARTALLRKNIRALIPGWGPDPGGGVEPAETRMTAIRQDGSSFPAQITCNPFITRDGRFLTTAIRDATDQVRAEARIQQINLELEQRVAERTAALTYSNEALRQFAWAASHDLQEPIRTVLSYSQWLAEISQDTLSQREGQMLDIIQQQASRLHQLLGALQQYIQVAESGESNWTAVNCNAAVETAISNLRGMIEESGASIQCAPLPTILGTDIMLVQLFQNLISNGIKYRRSEEAPRISIFAGRSGDTWTFSVRDNGAGIDPKYREYVFGVFKRLQSGQHAGTGMGLAICKAVVERLGGRIWIAESEGTGALVRFSLPGRMKA